MKQLPNESRKLSIETYLLEVERKLASVRNELKGELSSQSQREIKIFVYNSVNLLRTCLDYTYADIIEKVIRPNLNPNDKKLLKQIKRTHFPYDFKNSSSFTTNLQIKKISAVSPAIVRLIEAIQPYKDKGKTILRLCNFSNKLKHDDAIEKVVSETSFSIVKNKPKARSGIMVSGISNVVIEDCIVEGGDIILENTASAQLYNNIADNIHGMNATNNTFANNVIDGKLMNYITDLHLTFDYKNDVLERKTGVNILNLLGDSLIIVKKFSTDIYRII